jgi:deferrochelatase/peroxidase EfeB
MTIRLPDYKADVQRLIVYAYPQTHVRHLVLRVVDAAKAREFIAGLVADERVSNADKKPDDVARYLDRQERCPLNVGFTYKGLEALGLPKAYLMAFREKARAFAEGARSRAASRLGDSGASASQWWEKSFDPDHAHVLLTLHANGEEKLREFTCWLKRRDGAAGLRDGGYPPFDGEHLFNKEGQYREVHFGFRDGIAQPAIEGFHLQRDHNGRRLPRKLHKPGEFLLGHRNNDGFDSWRLIDPYGGANPWLRPHANFDAAFFANGSFAAFRKIEQHEDRFNAFLESAAEDLQIGRAYLKAKLHGRWDGGHVVRPRQRKAPEGRPSAEELDDFDFAEDKDLEGLGCPFGSHIRRMNPRADNSVAPARRRPLIRRGVPYGPRYTKDDAKTPRGLLGLFFCASLEDQFEHLLGQWGDMSPMGPKDRGNSKDPLIGNHSDLDAFFDIPEREGRRLYEVRDFEPFVTTRGTLYAFFPSLSAMNTLAKLPGQ